MVEIKAKLRYLRIAPRKVRAVVDLIRGLKVKEAENQLLLSSKRAAKPVLKLLRSAVANALNNYSLSEDELYIKRIETQDGPILYRWMPRAFGRATPIRRRSSHLIIVLEAKKAVPLPKSKKTEPLETKPEGEKKEKAFLKKEDVKKAKEDLKAKRRESFTKRIFRRKTI